MNIIMNFLISGGGLSVTADILDYRVSDFSDWKKMNDKVISVAAEEGSWRLYHDNHYTGTEALICNGVTFGKTELEAKGLYKQITSIRRDDNACRLEMWEHEYERGHKTSITGPTELLSNNDQASSVKAVGGPWAVYEHSNYEGKSMTICAGDTLNTHAKLNGFGDTISSARPVLSC